MAAGDKKGYPTPRDFGPLDGHDGNYGEFQFEVAPPPSWQQEFRNKYLHRASMLSGNPIPVDTWDEIIIFDDKMLWVRELPGITVKDMKRIARQMVDEADAALAEDIKKTVKQKRRISSLDGDSASQLEEKRRQFVDEDGS